jgi:hypothetical protein
MKSDTDASPFLITPPPRSYRDAIVAVHPPLHTVIDTESYRDLQETEESYRAYNFVSQLEIRAVGVLSRPYNQGTYGRCAGMARRPLTV